MPRTSNHTNKTTNVVPTTTRGKCAREPEDTIIESKPAPAKRAKVPTTIPDIQPGVRRSRRSPKLNGKVIIGKRKRRTKAEIEAANAAADNAIKQLAEEAKKAQQCLAQMDIDNDVERVETAANTIRRISDVHMAMSNTSDLDCEEFVGYNEVSSSSADESEDVENLEVSFFVISELKYLPLLHQCRRTTKPLRNGWKRWKRRWGTVVVRRRRELWVGRSMFIVEITNNDN